MPTTQPDFCINCAAYTAVDKAETEKEAAFAINETGVRYLAEQCAQYNCHLIHLSTDYVYHSQQASPYLETDACNPQSVYAKSKYAGEKALQQELEHWHIIRTSWVYGTAGHNFVKTMLRLGKERDALRIVFDQVGSPTFAEDLAKALLHLVQSLIAQPNLKQATTGVYNFSNEGVCSWYDFALSIFRIANISIRISPIRSSEYPTPAIRPSYSVMDKSKFKKTFAWDIPHWENALQRCLKTLSS